MMILFYLSINLEKTGKKSQNISKVTNNFIKIEIQNKSSSITKITLGLILIGQNGHLRMISD